MSEHVFLVDEIKRRLRVHRKTVVRYIDAGELEERERAVWVARAGFSPRFQSLDLRVDWLPAELVPWRLCTAIIVGPPGTGKSVSAQWFVREAIEQGYEARRVRVADLFAAILDRDRRIVDWLSRLPALALDDLGAPYESEFPLAELDRLIDARWEAGLATLVTSNLKPFRRDAGEESFEGRYPRSFSRLVNGDPGLVVVNRADLRRGALRSA